MEDRNCLECGRPIQGRRDKKFCTDGCRNAYNNRSKASVSNRVRNVNSTLAKNRKILAELNPKGKTKKHRDQLLKKGFDFDYMTNIYTTKAGDQYHFCYEQGYLELQDGFLLLVTREDS